MPVSSLTNSVLGFCSQDKVEKRQSPEIDSHVYSHLIYSKGTMAVRAERMVFFFLSCLFCVVV